MSKFREFLRGKKSSNTWLSGAIIDHLDEYLEDREQKKWTPLRDPVPAAVRGHYDRIIASTNHQLIQDRELLKERLAEVERQSAFLSASLKQENQKAREFSKRYVETAQRLAQSRGEWVPPCYSDPLTGYWKLGPKPLTPGGITYIGEEEMDCRVRSARDMDREIIRAFAPPAMVEGDLYPCSQAVYYDLIRMGYREGSNGRWSR